MFPFDAEDMFQGSFIEATNLLDGWVPSAIDQKRMLTHVVADLVQKVLSVPGSNPVGLTVTVTSGPQTPSGERPNLLVMATCPEYELIEPVFD